MFFARRKERSYDPKWIAGYFSKQNLEDRHNAINLEFTKRGLFHPALRDPELTAIYARYVRLGMSRT